jgi:hypothetical protein
MRCDSDQLFIVAGLNTVGLALLSCAIRTMMNGSSTYHIPPFATTSATSHCL